MMAKKGDMVYLPQDMNVSLAASDAFPAGRVVQLKKGFINLDDELAAHPLLSRLQTDMPGESDRRQKMVDAERECAEAVNAAYAKLAETRAAIDQERREQVNSSAEEWQHRRDEAAEKGLSFNEAHPDLETRRAFALTAPAATHATMTADQFTNSSVLAEERRAARETSEDQQNQRSSRRRAAVAETQTE